MVRSDGREKGGPASWGISSLKIAPSGYLKLESQRHGGNMRKDRESHQHFLIVQFHILNSVSWEV